MITTTHSRGEAKVAYPHEISLCEYRALKVRELGKIITRFIAVVEGVDGCNLKKAARLSRKPRTSDFKPNAFQKQIDRAIEEIVSKGNKQEAFIAKAATVQELFEMDLSKGFITTPRSVQITGCSTDYA